MIFYFSGTGNSLHAANVVAKAQAETIVSIAKEFDKPNHSFSYEFKQGEMLGIVYPIHAWAPPKMVLDFLNKMTITGSTPYVFSIATCGAEEGVASQLIRKKLAKRGLPLDGAFTLAMPNNYMFGVDLDPIDVQQKMLAEADAKLGQINDLLTRRVHDANLLLPGKQPKLKTVFINPMFNKFAMSPKPFFATDACTSCGLCEQICPVHTITVQTKPSWGKACTQCLACINRCPVQAIQYGRSTIGKGRYLHPDMPGASRTSKPL